MWFLSNKFLLHIEKDQMGLWKPITLTDSALCLLRDLQFLFFRQLLVSFVFQRVANVCLAIRVCGVFDIDNSTPAYRLEQRAWSLLFHIYSR